MKILITSGGTKVPIDDVRHIGNMSTGRFGAEIAREALRFGHQVVFLCAKGSARPDLVTLNLGHGNTIRTLSGLLTDNDLVWGIRNLLTVDEFRDFDEYTIKLQQHLSRDKPDVTMLAAAVSDYEVAPTAGKIPSDKDEITLTLTRLPKLIHYVKQRCPTTFLVGFKLLVDTTRQAMFEAASRQIAQAESDLVVVNDLKDIKQGRHILYIYERARLSDNPIVLQANPARDLVFLTAVHQAAASAQPPEVSPLVRLDASDLEARK